MEEEGEREGDREDTKQAKAEGKCQTERSDRVVVKRGTNRKSAEQGTGAAGGLRKYLDPSESIFSDVTATEKSAPEPVPATVLATWREISPGKKMED